LRHSEQHIGSRPFTFSDAHGKSEYLAASGDSSNSSGFRPSGKEFGSHQLRQSEVFTRSQLLDHSGQFPITGLSAASLHPTGSLQMSPSDQNPAWIIHQWQPLPTCMRTRQKLVESSLLPSANEMSVSAGFSASPSLVRRTPSAGHVRASFGMIGWVMLPGLLLLLVCCWIFACGATSGHSTDIPSDSALRMGRSNEWRFESTSLAAKVPAL
jgi:hypothetical protein